LRLCNGRFVCVTSSVGGTAPHKATWTILSGAARQTTPGGGNGTCTSGSDITVQVSVTDAVGNSATNTTGFLCSNGPDQ
jgi:hypothetical protein